MLLGQKVLAVPSSQLKSRTFGMQASVYQNLGEELFKSWSDNICGGGVNSCRTNWKTSCPCPPRPPAYLLGFWATGCGRCLAKMPGGCLALVGGRRCSTGKAELRDGESGSAPGGPGRIGQSGSGTGAGALPVDGFVLTLFLWKISSMYMTQLQQ